MEKRETGSKKILIIILILMVLQVVTAFYFCTQKQGCHYDEYYSYYSSNVTSGLIPTDNAWMDTIEIKNEFMVTDGMGFEYGMVKLMQTYDVHPPLYYYILHTVCSLSKNTFSLWQGLGINLFFYLLSILILWKISNLVGENNPYITVFSIALYGFSPAIISGVTFIRMYMLLTFLCMLGLYLHLKAIRDEKFGWKNLYIPVCITTFLGFTTHYYFAVFMFFMAAYMSLYLFFTNGNRKKSFIYAASVILGMMLAVVSYPACLGHIFRGYRGTEAIGAFVDSANTGERIGLFVGLLQEYLLCNLFYILVIIIILLIVTYRYLTKRRMIAAFKAGNDDQNGDKEDKAAHVSESANNRRVRGIMGMLIVITVGYFLVVMKTALTNAEEAIRYEMPVYGIIILLIVVALFRYTEKIFERNVTISKLVMLLLTVAVAFQFFGLMNNKVLFLYADDSKDYAWAREHSDDTIVYIYNYENQWMIWDDSKELMEYDRIFFIDMNNTEDITDTDVINSKPLYVFSVRSELAEDRLTSIVEMINAESVTKVRELKYVDVYELK